MKIHSAYSETLTKLLQTLRYSARFPAPNKDIGRTHACTSRRPWRFLILLCSTWFGVFLLTRLVLLLAHADEFSGNYFAVFFTGALYDLSFLIYAALPLGLYLALCPESLWRTRAHRWLMQGVLAVSLFVMLFVAVAEWLFWDEFGVRFNFIAVDYLVYSKEVLDNIRESYPLPTLLGSLAVAAVVLCLLLRKPLLRALSAAPANARQRLAGIAVLTVLCGASVLIIDQQFPRNPDGNAYQRAVQQRPVPVLRRFSQQRTGLQPVLRHPRRR